jgi:hypothetical protein
VKKRKEKAEMKEEEKEIKIRYAYLGSPTNMRDDPAYHETLRFTVRTIAELELRPNRIDFEEFITNGVGVIIRILGRDRCTGLMDVDGEEIFENDIIRWYLQKPKTHIDYAVEYCDNLFWSGGWEENNYPDTTKWCKIIGTTYDNKFKVVAEG